MGGARGAAGGGAANYVTVRPRVAANECRRRAGEVVTGPRTVGVRRHRVRRTFRVRESETEKCERGVRSCGSFLSAGSVGAALSYCVVCFVLFYFILFCVVCFV